MSPNKLAAILVALPASLQAAQATPGLQPGWYGLQLQMENSGRTYMNHLCMQKDGKMRLSQGEPESDQQTGRKQADLRGRWQLQNGQLHIWHSEGEALFRIELRYQPYGLGESGWHGEMALGPGAGKLAPQDLKTAGIWANTHKPPRYLAHSATLSFKQAECPPPQ